MRAGTRSWLPPYPGCQGRHRTRHDLPAPLPFRATLGKEVPISTPVGTQERGACRCRHECAPPRACPCSLSSLAPRTAYFLNGRASSRAPPPLQQPPWMPDLQIFVVDGSDSPARAHALGLLPRSRRRQGTRLQETNPPEEKAIAPAHASGLGDLGGREKK